MDARPLVETILALKGRGVTGKDENIVSRVVQNLSRERGAAVGVDPRRSDLLGVGVDLPVGEGLALFSGASTTAISHQIALSDAFWIPVA